MEPFIGDRKDIGLTIQDTVLRKAYKPAVWRAIQDYAKYKGILPYYGQRNDAENNNNIVRPNLNMMQLYGRLRKKDIRKLGRIQRIPTKMVRELSNMTYEDRLKKIYMTLKQRKERRSDHAL